MGLEWLGGQAPPTVGLGVSSASPITSSAAAYWASPLAGETEGPCPAIGPPRRLIQGSPKGRASTLLSNARATGVDGAACDVRGTVRYDRTRAGATETRRWPNPAGRHAVIPPICAVCLRDARSDRDAFPLPIAEHLVCFAEYEQTGEALPGQSGGSLWFCIDHLEAAQALSGLPSGPALARITAADQTTTRHKPGAR